MDKPKIRFKGYTDAWEQRKLGDCCDMYNGDRSSKYPNADDMVSDGIPFINAGDLENGTVNLMTCNRITREKYNDLGGAKLQRGDIVYCLRGTLGKNAFIDNFDEGTVASSLVALRPKNIGGKYLHFIINSDIEYRQRIVRNEGAAQPNLSAKSVSEYIIPVPSEAEQQQISAYFSRLDTLITLHQRKCEEVKKLKKYMLQNMFPRNGSNVPEIRFDGFTNAWEQRKLSELSDSFEYGLNAAAKEFDGENKYIRITDIDDASHEFNVDDVTSPDIDLANAGNYKLAEGDILFARTGASVGKTYIYKASDGLVYYAGFLIRARIKKEYNPEFVFQNTLTADYEKYIAVTSQRSGQPGVNAQEYSEYKIMVPGKEEQDKISAYLGSLDHLITLHQRKCEKLQNIKKFMLQNMFV